MSRFSDFITDFKKYPKSVHTALIFLYIGWAWFLMLLYMLVNEINMRMFIIALSMCILVIRRFNWARVLCLLCNALMIIYCSLFIIDFWQKGLEKNALLMAINVILFICSSYYLFIKETAEFFKVKKG